MKSAREHYPGLPQGYEPRIHLAEVVGVARVGSGVIRVTLGGADMADYPTTGVGDEYVRLFFPDEPDGVVRMPFVDGRGWDYPDGAAPSQMRTYTIRQHLAGEVDIDFIAHSGGIAAAWAMQARPGQRIALNPPIGLYDRPEPARKQILVADEPALPAALRIAELTAGAVDTVVIAEVPDARHQVHAAGVEVSYTWLRGSGNGQSPSALVHALRRHPLGPDTYVWVAGETRMTRHTRNFLRHEAGLAPELYKCIGYWTDKAEEWTERYGQLGAEFHERVRRLYESDRDTEEIADEVARLYEAAGL
ncbi:siderophore-interacting protein [Okibacterium endophyticum]